MGSIVWGQEVAESYDATSAAMFKSEVLDPVVDRLFEVAAGGRVLEFAIGTGRVALPLAARGVQLSGIELSPHMADQLRRKSGAEVVEVIVGDMTTTVVPGSFSLVYLVWNALMNVTTQAEQVAVFRNAAAHLAPGGRFVVEVVVPQLRRVPVGEVGHIFQFDPDHLGIETFDDTVEQIAFSHHWMNVNGRLVHHSAPYRYVWPSELVLMGQIAGFRLRDRWDDWTKSPFTPQSTQQVAVFEKTT